MNKSSFLKLRNELETYSSVLLFVIGFILMFLLLHSHQSHLFFKVVQELGVIGVLLCVFILSISNMFPIPVEFFSIDLMRIYGVKLGFLFSCISGVLGAMFAYFAARAIAQRFLPRIDNTHMKRVNAWIKQNEAIGLLALRFIPLVPYELVNYIAGMLRLNLFTFLWTTAVGVIPYQLAIAGMYSGVYGGHIRRGIFGLFLFIIIMLSGWFYKLFRAVKSR